MFLSEWREFPSAPCLAGGKKTLMTARVSMLKSRASLTCFRACFLPDWAKYLSAPRYRRVGGPQGRSGWMRNISPSLGFDPRTVQPVASRYTDWAIPAHFVHTSGVLFVSLRTTSVFLLSLLQLTKCKIICHNSMYLYIIYTLLHVSTFLYHRPVVIHLCLAKLHKLLKSKLLNTIP